MSKFNVGNWWSIDEFGGTQAEAIEAAIKHLTEDGWELEWFIKGHRNNNLGKWGRIGIRSNDGRITLFESDFEYSFMPSDKLSWSAFKQQTQYECPYAVIEELQCHVETLEEALEKVTKELIELREKVNSGEFNSNEFKPISEMTMEDWRQALDEQWEFVDGKGITLSVTRIEEDQFIFPLRMSDGCTYRINGWYFNGNEAFDIIKRIK